MRAWGVDSGTATPFLLGSLIDQGSVEATSRRLSSDHSQDKAGTTSNRPVGRLAVVHFMVYAHLPSRQMGVVDVSARDHGDAVGRRRNDPVQQARAPKRAEPRT